MNSHSFIQHHFLLCGQSKGFRKVENIFLKKYMLGHIILIKIED